MKAEQFYNKNQFIIRSDSETTFQSYDSEIITRNEKDKTITIFANWDYSKTTLKHFYLFLQDYLFFVWREISNTKNKKQAIKKIINQYQNEKLFGSDYLLIVK